MFSFFHKSSKGNAQKSPEQDSAVLLPDESALIAVLSAAISRFREQDQSNLSDAGFVVRRVRRI